MSRRARTGFLAAVLGAFLAAPAAGEPGGFPMSDAGAMTQLFNAQMEAARALHDARRNEAAAGFLPHAGLPQGTAAAQEAADRAKAAATGAFVSGAITGITGTTTAAGGFAGSTTGSQGPTGAYKTPPVPVPPAPTPAIKTPPAPVAPIVSPPAFAGTAGRR
jgi:hypothetical protein